MGPVGIAIVGTVGAVSFIATYIAFGVARKLGSELEPKDLLPAPPSVGLPLPRFLYEKPEVLRRLRGR